MRRRQAPVLDSRGNKQVHTSMWTQDAGGEWILPVSNLVVQVQGQSAVCQSLTESTPLMSSFEFLRNGAES